MPTWFPQLCQTLDFQVTTSRERSWDLYHDLSKDQCRQVSAQLYASIKGLHRESRTFMVWDLAEPRASRTSAWLELYHVVISLCVGEDTERKWKIRASKWSKRWLLIIWRIILCSDVAQAGGCLNVGTCTIKQVFDYQYSWKLCIRLELPLSLLHQHFILSTFLGTTLLRNQSALPVIGSGTLRYCSSGMQLAVHQKGSPNATLSPRKSLFLSSGSVSCCTWITSGNITMATLSALGLLVVAHAVAMICHDAYVRFPDSGDCWVPGFYREKVKKSKCQSWGVVNHQGWTLWK